MGKKFKVKVNGSMEFEFTQEQIDALDYQQISSSKSHLLKDKRSFYSEVTASSFLKREYTVNIRGNNYQIKIFNELDLLIRDMGLALGAAEIIKDIKAPMPGLILDVSVSEGDEVKKGDFLLVLEAMKMENSLTAPREGIVKSIRAQKGETVEKNQLLIEME